MMYLTVDIEAGVVKILVALRWAVHEAAVGQFTRLRWGGSRGCGVAVHEAAVWRFTRLRWGGSRGCGEAVHEAAFGRFTKLRWGGS